MVELSFSYKDLFRSPRIALSLQRVWTNFIGLFIGYGLYLILTYLSFLASGRSFLAMWDRYGFFPCLFGGGAEAPWYGWAIFLLGCVLLSVTILLTNTAVSRTVYMNLKGETFYTWKEAYSFAFKNLGSILGAPLAIAGVILLFVIAAIIMGLIGRIPYLGEFVTAGMTLLNMGAGLFVFFLMLVLCVAFMLVPAILATTDDDGFEAVFQSFSLSTGQPVRLIFYTAIVCIVELLALCIMAIAVKEAWIIYSELFRISMGDKFTEIGQQAMYYAQYSLAASRPWIEYYLGPDFLGVNVAGAIYFSRDFISVADLSAWENVCAYIFALFMLGVGALVVSYAEATGNSGLTLLYLVMRKHHDDENLLERKEENGEFEEEEPTVKEEKGDAEKKEEESSGESQEESGEEEGETK